MLRSKKKYKDFKIKYDKLLPEAVEMRKILIEYNITKKISNKRLIKLALNKEHPELD